MGHKLYRVILTLFKKNIFQNYIRKNYNIRSGLFIITFDLFIIFSKFKNQSRTLVIIYNFHDIYIV